MYVYTEVCCCLLQQLILANPGPLVMDKLQASNLANLIGEDKIFLTVSEAVTFCSPKLAEFEA